MVSSADAWSYSQTITLDTTASGANVPEDVRKYPLAVLLDKSRFDFNQARADGADIRFFDSAGKALPHAIELWDKASGSAAVWVLLDAGQRQQQRPIDRDEVGPLERAGHQRFEGGVQESKTASSASGTSTKTETPAPDGYKDASDHEAHGTGVGMIPGSRVDARIGKGVHLDNPKGQDTARWIRVSGEKAAQFNPGPPITVSIWALGYSYPIRSYETMIAKGDTSWTLQRVQYGPGGGAQKIGGQGYQTCVRTPSYHLCAYNFAGQGLVTKEWLHFMVVLEEPSMKLYINGQLNASESAGPWDKGDHDLGIGNQTQNLEWPAPVGRHSGRSPRDAGRPQPGLGKARLREPAGVADAPQVRRDSQMNARVSGRHLQLLHNREARIVAHEFTVALLSKWVMRFLTSVEIARSTPRRNPS